MRVSKYVLFVLTVLLLVQCQISYSGLQVNTSIDGASFRYTCSSQTNNVTMIVDDEMVLFLGDDVWQTINQNSYYSGLLDNGTVVGLLEQYERELLFITRTPWNDYVIIVGMNETFFVEMIIECTFNYTHIESVDNIYVIAGGEYILSLRTALSTAMSANDTLNLEMIAWDRSQEARSPLRAYLWSYAYTNHSILSIEENPHVTHWSNSNASEMLYDTHWEIITTTNIARLVANPNEDKWDVEMFPSMTDIFVSLDGELIQILSELEPVERSLDPIMFVVGSAILTVGIISLIIYLRKWRANE